jgi:hypothetical protein
VLFVSEGTLMAQRFNNRRLELQGEPIPLVEQVLIYRTSTYFSASANGVLVYRSGGRRTSQLAWFDRQGKALGLLGDPGTYGEITAWERRRHWLAQGLPHCRGCTAAPQAHLFFVDD